MVENEIFGDLHGLDRSCVFGEFQTRNQELAQKNSISFMNYFHLHEYNK